MIGHWWSRGRSPAWVRRSVSPKKVDPVVKLP